MLTTRGRLVRANQTVLDQADFLQADEFTRITGLTVADITAQVFFSNAVQPWTLVNGASVSDSQTVSGEIYFHEITGASGNYSVRFRPNTTGYWRLVLTYPAGQQALALDYDVEPVATSSGLKASLIGC